MKITFCCANTAPEPWLAGLRAALPQADIRLWQAGDAAADYGVVWSPPQQFFDEQTSLKAVFNIGAGVDALLRLNLPPGMRLIRLEDAGMAEQMAEYVLYALLRHFREFDAYSEHASQGQWQPRAPQDRADFPVGVLGLGALGSHVAQAVAQRGFPVRGWSRTPHEVPGVRCYSGQESLPQFLAATRVLVCLLPLTDATRDLLNRERLLQLQPGAYVINVARGALLVEDDLLALVESGHLAGAMLDVLRTEPLPPEHPLWRHPRISITPHISARTLMLPALTQIAAKLAVLQAGTPVAGEVNLQLGY
jgi:glyoxylate/hydroxypyruvate reductase